MKRKEFDSIVRELRKTHKQISNLEQSSKVKERLVIEYLKSRNIDELKVGNKLVKIVHVEKELIDIDLIKNREDLPKKKISYEFLKY